MFPECLKIHGACYVSLFQYGYVLRKIYSLLPFILDKLIVSGEERKNSIRIFFIQYTVFRFIDKSAVFKSTNFYIG